MRSRWFVLPPVLFGLLTVGACARAGRPAPANEPQPPAVKPADDPPQPPQQPQQPEQKKPAGNQQAQQPEFRFPDDAGGVLLARLLRPGTKSEPDRTTQPRRKPAGSGLDDPQPPLPQAVASVPRLNANPISLRLHPRLNLEETLDGLAEAQPLSSGAMPQGERVRTPAQDVKVPPPLPRVATPVPDRASLEDPTQDLSAAAVQTAQPTVRHVPVPFQRVNLPDPFENRNVARPPPLGEEEVPGTPRP
jgi:hypothetical protein